MNCTERCIGHCIKSEPCDHVSGVCTSGCQDGYIGLYCNGCKNPTLLHCNDIFALNVCQLISAYCYTF